MPKYLEKKEDDYYVAQWFGYSLISLAKTQIKQGNAKKIRHYEENIIDKKEIFDFLLNSMIFSSHYIEDSLFYIDYTKYSNEEYNKKYPKNKEIRREDRVIKTDEEYELEEKQMKDERLPIFSSYLKNSVIKNLTTLYKIPYSLEGKQLGYRTIETTWEVYENNELKKYQMLEKGLICFINEDNTFNHIEPAFGGLDCKLDTPHIEKERQNRTGLSVPDMFAETQDSMIEDAIEIGILIKNKAF